MKDYSTLLRSFFKSKLAVCSLVILTAGAAITGCSLLPATGAPPTKVESAIYNVQTNYLTVVVPVTNMVPVTIFHTNNVTVTQTNTLGVTQVVTNIVIQPVIIQQPVVGEQTNQVPNYSYTPKPGAGAVVNTIGTVVNTFFPGAGSLVATGVTGLIGLWGYLRSSKNFNTSAAIAQEVETIREFVKGLPNGATYDAALTNFLQAHQADANVLNQVLNLLKNEVSNSDAQIAAQQIQQTISALTGGTVNPGAPAPATPPAAPKV